MITAATDRALDKLSRALSFGPQHDGRLIAMLMVAIYLATVAGARGIFSIDLWPHLGVPSGPTLFFDARNVAAAAECREIGLDPLVHNPCDPWDRPMVYPRVWLALRWVGLNQDFTVVLGVAAGLTFLAAAMLLLGRLTVGQGIVTGFALCSPAVMFALERGNMDLVVFAMTAWAAGIWRSRHGRFAAPLLVLTAAIAKLYPVYGLVAFLWGRGRRIAFLGLACFALFAVYAVVTLSDIRAIAASAPQGEYYSYGARILVARLYHVLLPDEPALGGAIKQLVAGLPLIVVAIALWIAAKRRTPAFTAHESASVPLLAFHLGALIYVGSFLVSNNFDYRLIYLLLTFPQLFRWTAAEHGAASRRTLAGVTLVIGFAELWVSTLSEYVLLMDEIISWTLAGLMIALIAGSTPAGLEMWRTVMRPGEGSPERMAIGESHG